MIVRTGAITANVGGGTNGITNTADSPPGGIDHGALPGNSGVNLLIAESADPVTNSGYKCLPLTDLSLTKAASTSTLSIGQTTNFTLTIGNSGPQQATAATVVDTLPTGLGSLALVSATGSNASTTLTSSSISGSTFAGTVTIPVNQTLTLVLRGVATVLEQHHRVVAGVGVSTVLAIALAITSWQANQAFREASRAEAMQGFVVALFENTGDKTNPEDVNVRELLDAGVRRADTELSNQPQARAELLGLIARLHNVLVYGVDSPQCAPEPLRAAAPDARHKIVAALAELTQSILGKRPQVTSILVEDAAPVGPFGAKGVGEMPMDGPAPAFVAAVSQATGAVFQEIPLTPERIAERARRHFWPRRNETR